jgi:hypothetical protein
MNFPKTSLPEEVTFKKATGIIQSCLLYINPEYDGKVDEFETYLGFKARNYAPYYDGSKKDKNDVSYEQMRYDFYVGTENYGVQKVSIFVTSKQLVDDKTKKASYITDKGFILMKKFESLEEAKAWSEQYPYKGKAVRIAYNGESQLYDFIRNLVGESNWKVDGANLLLSEKPFTSKAVKELINSISPFFTLKEGMKDLSKQHRIGIVYMVNEKGYMTPVSTYGESYFEANEGVRSSVTETLIKNAIPLESWNKDSQTSPLREYAESAFSGKGATYDKAQLQKIALIHKFVSDKKGVVQSLTLKETPYVENTASIAQLNQASSVNVLPDQPTEEDLPF